MAIRRNLWRLFRRGVDFKAPLPQLAIPLSDLPLPEYLNPTSASSIRQVLRSPATIPLHDYQSFVTDHPQQWLTQPQSPRLPTPASSHALPTPDSDTDFVLFPSPTQRLSTLVPATVRTDPNYLSQSSYNGQVKSHRQFSTQIQRVGNVHGSSPVSSNGLHSGIHASSASSPTLQRQRKSHARPPVPLFPNNSTDTINQIQHTFASESESQGSSLSTSNVPFALTTVDMVLQDLSRAGALTAHTASPFDDLMASNFSVTNEPFDATASYDSSFTVSPRDVLLDSAPPSSVFSNLTTPENGYLESPQTYINNSPNEQDFGDDPDLWPTLFPETEEQDQKHAAQSSPVKPYTAPAMSRTTSSGQLSSRSSHHGRMSASSGVSKRRTQPLPPIKVDENDTVAVKRARNTLAARKSRQRRMEKAEELESEVQRLTQEVEMWKTRATQYGYPAE
ncbi:MAG: hypothetical protein HETSPECPRED_009952 [Heterodermia speciosa]|uniref:BZIP domain-containing protein n=1 Tax=Heterodermia speciosa TaxID=116794 RepID=A0A8H3IWS5_9LECA|nr:MAG: hypothetical protein HETSPECPRED_009952 [Heterodermia speciosa]